MKKIINGLRTGVLFCIKWRYLIALIVFIFCVALNLHGSSINEYNKMFANSEEYNAESMVLGESRAIRSDEWLVNVPNYMSQKYNNYEKQSNMMSLEGQDMIIATNAPVLDVTILAKPFMWGYVMFGNDYGLSWFWCSKLILLLLISFELCMIITQKNKKVSLIGMMLLSFAPAMQWWGMIDAYIWGMALLVLGYHFFTSQLKMKNLCTILLPFVAVAFILVLYPAFQWPTGLLMVALLIALLIRDKKKIMFKKIDILRIIVIIVLVVSIMAYTVATSWKGITTMMGTVYPGAVVALGGNYTIASLFTDLSSFVLPFKNITYLNNSEVSTFVHFAPVFLMLYPIIYKKMKRDKNIIVGNVLVGCLVFMIVFMLAGFPELLAKITGFSYITRMKTTYELAATIFTIWGINEIWKKQILSLKNVLVVIAIYVFCYICFIGKQELSYLDWWQYAIILVGLAGLLYVMLRGHKTITVMGVVLLMCICGATINPVVRGTTAITGHPLEQKIAEIANEDRESYWLANGDTKLASIGMANGAKMLNMVNVYPDFKKWELIDPERKEEDIYNRYAHIKVDLVEKDTEIELGPSRDMVVVKLSCKDAKKWPVDYLIMLGDLKSCKSDYKEIYKDTEGDYRIYKEMEKE